MSKKKEPKVKERINWRKEASLLPGYIIVLVWIIFTAAFLLWILGASLSTSREIFSGSVFKFESGLHFENYVNAWKAQNVSVFFANSLLYAITACVGVILISAPAASEGQDSADTFVYFLKCTLYNNLSAQLLRNSE